MNRNLSLLLVFLICLPIVFVPSSVRGQTSTPTVQIDPPSVTVVQTGQTLALNVTVAAVNLLSAWEFQIYYKSGVLSASNWTPGPVFNSSGVMIFNQTWTDNYNTTDGLVDIVCTFIGQKTFSGTTTLATVYFKVKSYGITLLGLQNTSLLDNSSPFPQEILHNETEGGVNACTILADLNGDGKVSLNDLVILANAYGTKAGRDPPGTGLHQWNPIADIDGNGVVGLTDLVRLALNYGKHSP
jgi:hypothetical protein